MDSTKYLTLAVAIVLGVLIIMGYTLSTAFGATNGAGESLYAKKCLSCHPVTPGAHKLGPSLAGMVGRKAGTAPGFSKYKGLIGSNIVWTEDALDKWLANPKAFLGKRTSMVYKLRNEKQRAAIIEYMKTLK